MTTQVVRPAGAGHETLYVLLLCLLNLAVAGSVVAWRHESQEVTLVAAHQLDARRDLNAAEQGLYADLRVTLDEILLLKEESGALPLPAHLADEGFAPFAIDASSVSRGRASGEETSAAEPSPTSISPADVRTAMRPSLTLTLRPARAPGAQAGSHTVSSAR